MSRRYIDLMVRALSAYSQQHINRYFNSVKSEGLSEHGFPRLTSNIGILISHGFRKDLTEIFIEMMDFCCDNIPKRRAANDFSIREIIACIREVESSGVIDSFVVDRWKRGLSTIEPLKCYDVRAESENDRVKNWALFSCLSEFFRQKMGLCNSEKFIDNQIYAQLKWFDENGMYMDGKGVKHHPINYDIVPRGLFSLLLNEGYRGKHYKKIDEILKKSALLTLKMQSPNGEMAFGGRSNQFLYTEGWMMVIYEYEAKRYAREGNIELAEKFKAASARALSVTDYWLNLNPISHIRNRFPIDTKHGCEDYAYFDKYMITVSSNLYAAYTVCDDSIGVGNKEDTEPSLFATSKYFHKLFAKAGGYGIEVELDADPCYDANGTGRVHKAGAPGAICISVPCPQSPEYSVAIDQTCALSLSPAIKLITTDKSKWAFASATDVEWNVLSNSEFSDFVKLVLRCNFNANVMVDSEYTVSEKGVDIIVKGDGEIGFVLPAFYFDGESYTNIVCEQSSLSVEYKGWVCKYTVDCEIIDDNIISANRNGYYKRFLASGRECLHVNISITERGET